MTTKKTTTNIKPKAAKNAKTNARPKSTTSSKAKSSSVKKNIKGKIVERKNFKILLMVTFFTGVILIISSYAWLSQSLNVKVKFFDLSVSTDNGLFISLDGIDYTDSVEISLDSVINNLRATYPNHTNQWASGGLWPVSSNGIRNSNINKFDIFSGEVSRRKGRNNRRFLNAIIINEDRASESNAYISFDLFLKNVSGSPKSDNLYLDDDTFVDFGELTSDDVKDSMSGIMNSMRFGFVRIGSVPSKTDVNTVQNMKCNNNCKMIIYEPNSTSHSNDSIEKVKEYGVTLINGIYSPTYGLINEGEYLDHANGQEGTGIPLDTTHFALQRTITSFEKPIFEVPNGVTKLRVYVWIEGQDMDSLETHSKGAAIDIAINFVKDLAGYE